MDILILIILAVFIGWLMEKTRGPEPTEWRDWEWPA